MASALIDEAKSILRLHRAIIGAAAAAVIVIGGACYAVYRLQSVLEGMTEQRKVADDLNYTGDDAWKPTRASVDSTAE